MIRFAGYTPPKPVKRTGFHGTEMRERNVHTFLRLLRDRRTLLSAEAARTLNVCQRSIFRYIDDLRAQGLKIDTCKGRGGGIRLRD